MREIQEAYKDLKEGMVFKNYNDLFNSLGVEKKVGKQHEVQKRDLERFISYKKDGHKIIITEVFEYPLPKEYKSIYQVYAQKIIMDILAKNYLETKKDVFIISKGMLMYIMDMTNNKYGHYKTRKLELENDTGVPLMIIDEFYSLFDSKFESIINSSLNRLANSSIIHHSKIMMIDGVEATKSEVQSILESETQALKEFNVASRRDIFLLGAWNVFYPRVLKILSENHNMNVKMYYRAYKIIHTDNLIANIDRFISVQPDIKEKLKNVLIEEHIKASEKKIDKLIGKMTLENVLNDTLELTKSESKRLCYMDDYVTHQKTLIDVVIK